MIYTHIYLFSHNFIIFFHSKAEKSWEEVKSQKAELVQESNLLKQELDSLREEVHKKDTALGEMQNEVRAILFMVSVR